MKLYSVTYHYSDYCLLNYFCHLSIFKLFMNKYLYKSSFTKDKIIKLTVQHPIKTANAINDFF